MAAADPPGGALGAADPSKKPAAGDMGPWRDHSVVKGELVITSNMMAENDRDELKHTLFAGRDTATGGKKVCSVATALVLLALVWSAPPALRTFYGRSHAKEKTKLALDVEYEFDNEKHNAAWRARYPDQVKRSPLFWRGIPPP